MSVWFLIAFIAQFLWVAGALIDKTLLAKYAKDAEDVDSVNALVFISGTFSTIIALGIYLFNFSQISLGTGTLLGLLSGICNGLWVYLYLQAVEVTESSKVIPLFQTIPIFGMVFAVVFLGEVLSNIQIFSIFIIVTGSLVLTFNLQEKKLDLAPIVLMFVASAVVALQETIFKVADSFEGYWNATFWMLLGFPVFVLILNLREHHLFTEAKELFTKKFIPMWGFSTVNEIIDNSATLLFVFAVTLAPVAIVQSVNALQPIIMLIAATILAKLTKNYIDEDLSSTSFMQKTVGILIITIGSVFLYGTLF